MLAIALVLVALQQPTPAPAPTSPAGLPPQVADTSPKTQITKDGAVWYAVRDVGSGMTISKLGVGMAVLYPDMDKITTLGAYYLNGPPGYSYQGAPIKSQQ